jgi:hypothetical protein
MTEEIYILNRVIGIVFYGLIIGFALYHINE